ncbi:HNH endonuclease, partial [Klebsiella quasipneumoniae]
NGITGNNDLLEKFHKASTDLELQVSSYENSALTEELFTIQPIKMDGVADPVILKGLKKSDFIKLYTLYLVGMTKPAREIYDVLMASANERCPFCGGIGRPRNLDHYLPKAYFPQFAIAPMNLVPSCRDCNMDGKGEDFATSAGEQILHPYLDNDRYFNDQWIFARYLAGAQGEPGVIEYFVSPPVEWDANQKERVIKHFNDFNLSLRYSKEASARLGTLLSQYDGLLKITLDKETSKQIIFQTVIDNAAFINHWERVMCLALMRDL